jgi:outer membrane receptor protein involved in Fe transport
MGGTIKLIPNAPNASSFDASAALNLGGTDGGGFNHQESAMVNLPLLQDTLALRVVGTQQHVSGWIDRVVIQDLEFPQPVGNTRGDVAAAPVRTDHRDVNDEDLTSVRVSALWKPIDGLSISPSFLYQEVTMDGLSLVDSDPGTYTNYQPYDNPEPFADRIDLSSLNVQYHFAGVDLSSTTSYWNRDENLRQDGTEAFATVIGAPIYPSEGGAGENFPSTLEDDRSRQWTEEFRLTSQGDSALKWLLGYFYQDFESDVNLYADTPFTAIPGTIANAFTQHQPTKLIQNSVFGEVTYEFLPKWSATAGLRRYAYNNSVENTVSGWLSSSQGAAADTFYTQERNQGMTPKFNLSYSPDKDSLLYATAAKGFRPGGGNQPIPTTGLLGQECLANLQAIGLNSAPLGFKPDSVWSYELGEKFRDSSHRLTINAAGYFENWQHIQQNIPLPCGFPFTGNAGDAHIYGGEVEVSALLMPGLVLEVNGAWTHARYVQNAVPDATLDDRVQSIPDWTTTASVSYRRPITQKLGLIARVDNSYVGSRVDTTAQANYLPSYDLTNVRAGVEADRWSALLYVTNVANKMALISNSPAINVNSPTFNRVAVAQPLTIGLDLHYSLGVR